MSPADGPPPEPPEPPAATTDAYFDRMWSTGDDPWDHGGRWYEARKYRLTVAALPRRRYRRAFEPGCGTGLLTALLAPRVDRLVACDRSARAVDVTRRRCADLAGVEVTRGRLPDGWPGGTFDLVVLSEVLYYLDDAQLDRALAHTVASLDPHGHVVAVHYRQPVAEHARLGDDVHERLATALPELLVRHVEDDFVLEVRAA